LWWSLGIGLILIASGAATVWYTSTTASDKSNYLTHNVARGRLVVTVTEQGTLESSSNTEIKCNIRGFSTVTWVIPTGTIVEEDEELVRLDTKVVEEQYSLTKTNTFIAEATLAESQASVDKANIAIEAYEKGRYRSQLQELEKDLETHKRNLRNARGMMARSETLFRQGFATALEVEANGYTLKQAELELQVKETEIHVLQNFTREMQLETLKGNLIASESKLAADKAGLAMEIKRRDRAKQELADCVIRAPRSGLVIYPSAASWKSTPDITEGATVRKDQVLLLIPDLRRMQVRLGVHESVVDQVRPGLEAIVTLPDRTLRATVSEVASVTRPAGWWTGNVVKYDTVIELPEDEGLKPGMSAEVEIVLSEQDDVLLIPVAAVVESEQGSFCWVETQQGAERRPLRLGKSNDVFIEVLSGLTAGDPVLLNPAAMLEDAETEMRTTVRPSTAQHNASDAAQQTTGEEQ